MKSSTFRLSAFLRRAVALAVLLTFCTQSILPVYAQTLLPPPGVRIDLSPVYQPAVLRGLKVDPAQPFKFDFIVDAGDSGLNLDTTGRSALQAESTKLIKYFLASLTTPEDDLWVNLSPYEKDRIIPESFGTTEMGRDLLAQDYLLKQITASIIDPQKELGQKFWDNVYRLAYERFGTTEVPVATFNKVWVVPDKAVVYEHDQTAFVTKTHLKVMLEEDYVAMSHQRDIAESSAPSEDVALSHQRDMAESPAPPVSEATQQTEVNQLGAQILRAIIIPELEREVNEGKNFAELRQVYNSLILATWYKKKLKDSILAKVYVDRKKTAGIHIESQAPGPQGPGGAAEILDAQKIYAQYLEAFKKGVYNYIKEDYDPATQETIPRKYFSGGFGFAQMPAVMTYTTNPTDPDVSTSFADFQFHQMYTVDGEMHPIVDGKIGQVKGEGLGDRVQGLENTSTLTPNPSTLTPDADRAMLARAGELIERAQKKVGTSFDPLKVAGWFLLYSVVSDEELVRSIDAVLSAPKDFRQLNFPLGRKEKDVITQAASQWAKQQLTDIVITSYGPGRDAFEFQDALEVILPVLESNPPETRLTLIAFDNNAASLNAHEQALRRLVERIAQSNPRWKDRIDVRVYYGNIKDNSSKASREAMVIPSNLTFLRNTWSGLKFEDLTAETRAVINQENTATQIEEFKRYLPRADMEAFGRLLQERITSGALIVDEPVSAGEELRFQRLIDRRPTDGAERLAPDVKFETFALGEVLHDERGPQADVPVEGDRQTIADALEELRDNAFEVGGVWPQPQVSETSEEITVRIINEGNIDYAKIRERAEALVGQSLIKKTNADFLFVATAPKLPYDLSQEDIQTAKPVTLDEFRQLVQDDQDLLKIPGLGEGKNNHSGIGVPLAIAHQRLGHYNLSWTTGDGWTVFTVRLKKATGQTRSERNADAAMLGLETDISVLRQKERISFTPRQSRAGRYFSSRELASSASAPASSVASLPKAEENKYIDIRQVGLNKLVGDAYQVPENVRGPLTAEVNARGLSTYWDPLEGALMVYDSSALQTFLNQPEVRRDLASAGVPVVADDYIAFINDRDITRQPQAYRRIRQTFGDESYELDLNEVKRLAAHDEPHNGQRRRPTPDRAMLGQSLGRIAQITMLATTVGCVAPRYDASRPAVQPQPTVRSVQWNDIEPFTQRTGLNPQDIRRQRTPSILPPSSEANDIKAFNDFLATDGQDILNAYRHHPLYPGGCILVAHALMRSMMRAGIDAYIVEGAFRWGSLDFLHHYVVAKVKDARGIEAEVIVDFSADQFTIAPGFSVVGQQVPIVPVIGTRDDLGRFYTVSVVARNFQFNSAVEQEQDDFEKKVNAEKAKRQGHRAGASNADEVEPDADRAMLAIDEVLRKFAQQSDARERFIDTAEFEPPNYKGDWRVLVNRLIDNMINPLGVDEKSLNAEQIKSRRNARFASIYTLHRIVLYFGKAEKREEKRQAAHIAQVIRERLAQTRPVSPEAIQAIETGEFGHTAAYSLKDNLEALKRNFQAHGKVPVWIFKDIENIEQFASTINTDGAMLSVVTPQEAHEAGVKAVEYFYWMKEANIISALPMVVDPTGRLGARPTIERLREFLTRPENKDYSVTFIYDGPDEVGKSTIDDLREEGLDVSNSQEAIREQLDLQLEAVAEGVRGVKTIYLTPLPPAQWDSPAYGATREAVDLVGYFVSALESLKDLQHEGVNLDIIRTAPSGRGFVEDLFAAITANIPKEEIQSALEAGDVELAKEVTKKAIDDLRRLHEEVESRVEETIESDDKENIRLIRENIGRRLESMQDMRTALDTNPDLLVENATVEGEFTPQVLRENLLKLDGLTVTIGDRLMENVVDNDTIRVIATASLTKSYPWSYRYRLSFKDHVGNYRLPVSDLDVFLIDQNGRRTRGLWSAARTSLASGEFTFRGLDAGEYRVQVKPRAVSTGSDRAMLGRRGQAELTDVGTQSVMVQNVSGASRVFELGRVTVDGKPLKIFAREDIDKDGYHLRLNYSENTAAPASFDDRLRVDVAQTPEGAWRIDKWEPFSLNDESVIKRLRGTQTSDTILKYIVEAARLSGRELTTSGFLGFIVARMFLERASDGESWPAMVKTNGSPQIAIDRNLLETFYDQKIVGSVIIAPNPDSSLGDEVRLAAEGQGRYTVETSYEAPQSTDLIYPGVVLTITPDGRVTNDRGGVFYITSVEHHPRFSGWRNVQRLPSNPGVSDSAMLSQKAQAFLEAQGLNLKRFIRPGSAKPMINARDLVEADLTPVELGSHIKAGLLEARLDEIDHDPNYDVQRQASAIRTLYLELREQRPAIVQRMIRDFMKDPGMSEAKKAEAIRKIEQSNVVFTELKRLLDVEGEREAKESGSTLYRGIRLALLKDIRSQDIDETGSLSPEAIKRMRIDILDLQQRAKQVAFSINSGLQWEDFFEITGSFGTDDSQWPSSDRAMLGDNQRLSSDRQTLAAPTLDRVGGIDFNPKKMNLEVDGDGTKFEFTFDPAQLENLRIDGFVPVIIDIQPVKDVPLLLGIRREEDQQVSML